LAHHYLNIEVGDILVIDGQQYEVHESMVIDQPINLEDLLANNTLTRVEPAKVLLSEDQ
jgi:hypothetical protein